MILLATLLRVHQIGVRDFWYDEAFTSVAAQGSYRSMLTLLTQDVHPPLFFFFTKSVTDLFGATVAWTRFFPALFGVLSVYIVYLFTKELISRRAGMYAAFFAAICPFLIQYSQEARMYSQYAFFVGLAAYFLIRVLKYKQHRDVVFFGCAVGLGALTHYMSLLYIGIFYAVVLVWQFPLPLLTHGDVRSRVCAILNWLFPARFFAGISVAFVLFLPWISRFLVQYADKQDKTKWIPEALLKDIPRTLWMLVIGTPPGELGGGVPSPHELTHVPEIVAVTFCSLLFLGVFLWLLRKKTKEGLILFLLSGGFALGIFALSLLGKHYFLPRYLLPVSLFLMAALGSFVASIRFPWRATAIVSSILVLFLIVPVSPSTGYNELNARLDQYQGFHFYSLNSFDYLIAKAYFGEDRLRLYNVGWPQYDSRFWPGIGLGTKRVEELNILKQDPHGLILWNVEFPLTERDDRLFPADQFTLIEQYHDLAIYAPKRENSKIAPK